MKRFASVLVRRRRIILALTLLCCCISLVLIPQVEINTDMTKYLPDDSSMQQGMDIMEVEFPDTELAKTIRVMFQGLEEEQIPEILATLESIEYVDSVAYEADSTDYNREDYTLFVVSTEYDYGSPQERAIESALEEDFSGYDMVFKNDSTNTMDLPAWVIGLALTVLMIILFFMCSSWAEPFLFMLNIGIAIAINMGTNRILGSISTVTFSIAAILQLVLSMDYSVILMNRYRQEREHTADRPAAMEIALRNAFSSVVSSGMTTVVGLLMLVFMRFRIGMDLGIVLAKGVLITMICTFTSLPGLILLFDGLIMRTAKKALHIPTGGLAAFSYRRRRVLAAVFVALFIGSYFLKNATDTVFTLEANDPIVDIFPTENSLVLVYENQDEDQVAALAETLEDDPYVKSALSYSTTLARARTSRELADAAEELGGQTIDSSLLNIVYYHRFMDGQLPSIAAGDFLRFLQKDVLSQDTFDEYISQDMRQQAEKLERFSDPQALTTPMDAAELADFLELEESDVRQLLVLYLAEHGDVDSGRMTLPVFVRFLTREVANDPDYAGYLDTATLQELQRLETFTDVGKMTAPITAPEMASLLGLAPEQAELLYAYYQALSAGYEPAEMTLGDFVSFLTEDVANDPILSGQIDSAMLAQLSALAPFTDKAAVQTPLSGDALAAALGLEPALVDTVLSLYYGSTGSAAQTMTLPAFTGFLVNSVLSNPAFSGSFDDSQKAQLTFLHQLITAAGAKEECSPARMAELLGLDAGQVEQLYYLYGATGGLDVSAASMTLPQFTNFLVSEILSDPAYAGSFTDASRAQLTALDIQVTASASQQAFSAGELAQLTDMDAATVEAILQGAESMTLPAFLTAATGEPFASQMDPGTLAQLQAAASLCLAAAAGQTFTPAQMAQALGLDPALTGQIYLLYFSAEETLTPAEFTSFLIGTVLTDPNYGAAFSPEQKAQLTMLHQLVTLADSGQALPPAQMAQALGLDESMVQTLYALYAGAQMPNKTMTLEQFVNYLVALSADPGFSGWFDAATVAQLTQLQQLIQATVSGAAFSSGEMAQLLGMQEQDARMLFAVREGQAASWTVAPRDMVDFLVENSAVLGGWLDAASLSQLQTLQRIIAGSVDGVRYNAACMAGILGIGADELEPLFLLYTLEHGDTSSWKAPVRGLVDFLVDDVLSDDSLADRLDEAQAEDLTAARALVDAVADRTACSAGEMTRMLSAFDSSLEKEDVELLYLFYGGKYLSDPDWEMSMEEFFNYVADTLLDDPRFEGLLDQEYRAQIDDYQVQIDEGIQQLRGENYSLMMVTTTYPSESPETTAFIADIIRTCDETLKGEYHLVGNSSMNYEMEQTFDNEVLLITLLTVASIFLVVALTFRSLIIPAVLVLLVQCGVYITISASGVRGYSIYYLALLIVECILMGATIDYAILFTNYYRENRQSMAPPEALAASYRSSIHTILTSGLLIILGTGIIGFSPVEPTIGQICQTISVGALSASLLILFILPGLLATLDRFVCGKKK